MQEELVGMDEKPQEPGEWRTKKLLTGGVRGPLALVPPPAMVPALGGLITG